MTETHEVKLEQLTEPEATLDKLPTPLTFVVTSVSEQGTRVCLVQRLGPEVTLD